MARDYDLMQCCGTGTTKCLLFHSGILYIASHLHANADSVLGDLNATKFQSENQKLQRDVHVRNCNCTVTNSTFYCQSAILSGTYLFLRKLPHHFQLFVCAIRYIESVHFRRLLEEKYKYFDILCTFCFYCIL